MNYLISYDVCNDKKRKILSDYLIEKGLLRIQMSVFIGDISNKNILILKENLKNLINQETDSIYCIPISKAEYNNIFSFGKVIDYKLYDRDILYI